MKQYIKIDLTTGLFIEDVILEDNDPVSEDLIDIPCKSGFYHPKWDFTLNDWVEGGSAPPIDLEAIKTEKINESNLKLADYLLNHPLLYTDGLYYSVSLEKQNLLAGQLLTYQLEIQLGNPNPELTWNSTGEECSEWTFENLALLSLAIKNYVKPFVSKQRELEKLIKLCTTLEELNNIDITFEIGE
jgi:hypothetical protein